MFDMNFNNVAENVFKQIAKDEVMINYKQVFLVLKTFIF